MGIEPTRAPASAGASPELAEFRLREDERRAAGYARSFAPVTAQAVDAVVARLGDPLGCVLDLGCGDGTLGAALECSGWRVLAVDRSLAMARLASERVRVVAVADAARLPIRDGAVDAVVSAFLVPHLPALQPALAELRRVLVSGGRLVLTSWAEPAASPFTGLVVDLVRALGGAHAELLDELRGRADEVRLAAELQQAGFEGIEASRITMVAEMASVSTWWKALVASSCGLGGLIQAQRAEVRRDLRGAFEAQAGLLAMPDGSVVVPATAVLLSADG